MKQYILNIDNRQHAIQANTAGEARAFLKKRLNVKKLGKKTANNTFTIIKDR